MTLRFSQAVYEVVTRLGLNPALKAADVADQALIDVVEGPGQLNRGRALDLGCGAGRNSLYLARNGWQVIGIDLVGHAVELAQCAAVGAAASARFLQGDVTRLGDLHIGDNYDLINDSGCYYGLAESQRDAYAAGVTWVAAPGALLLMAGFTKIPRLIPGISEEDVRRRFTGWHMRETAEVPISEIERHTRIPFRLKAAMKRGSLQILRFALTRVTES
jgi:SAM-dependent methyltransferase